MDVLVVLSIVLLALLATKVIAFIVLSSRHHAAQRRMPVGDLSRKPLVSIIVPCYNEELVVENCVTSLRIQTYDELEIVLVDDGSSDRTASLICELAERFDNVRAFTKVNGGKASALNFGLEHALGEVVVCMDADSMFLADTVEQLVRSFEDPKVAAVGGNVRVANRNHAMTRHQAAEYITGLTLQRRGFAHLGCMQVISGAIGAFRRSVLVSIGGYSEDTIVEDMDITVTLARHGHRVVYNPGAIAYTEAPESVSGFLKQRYRWTFGGLQVVSKHRDMLFNRKFGRMGTIGLPYCAIFPWVDAIASLLLIAAVVRVLAGGDGAGTLLLIWGTLCLVQACLAAYALVLDGENRRLAAMGAVESLFYAHLINFTTVRAGVNYVRGAKVSWDKLQRLGKNTPQGPPVAVPERSQPSVRETEQRLRRHTARPTPSRSSRDARRPLVLHGHHARLAVGRRPAGDGGRAPAPDGRQRVEVTVRPPAV